MSNQDSNNTHRPVRFPDGTVLKSLDAEIRVDQESMESQTVFLYEGVACPTVAINSPIAKALAGYALIAKDLKFVLKTIALSIDLQGGDDDSDAKYVVRSEDDKEADLLKALYLSMVITYGKCFASAFGRRVRLNARKLFKSKRELHDVHKDLMDQRNQFVAHSGKSPLERVQTLVVLHPDQSAEAEPMLTTASVHANSWGVPIMRDYRAVVEHVREHVVRILERKSQSLWEREIITKDSGYWYKQLGD